MFGLPAQLDWQLAVSAGKTALIVGVVCVVLGIWGCRTGCWFWWPPLRPVKVNPETGKSSSRHDLAREASGKKLVAIATVVGAPIRLSGTQSA